MIMCSGTPNRFRRFHSAGDLVQEYGLFASVTSFTALLDANVCVPRPGVTSFAARRNGSL